MTEAGVSAGRARPHRSRTADSPRGADPSVARPGNRLALPPRLLPRSNRGAPAGGDEPGTPRGGPRPDRPRAPLDHSADGAPEQVQAFAVLGHKADFGVMMAGKDLKAIHAVQVAIQASALGPALTPVYSFYSITEVSEYVPDAEEYGAHPPRAARAWTPRAPRYKAKVDSLHRPARADGSAAAAIPRLPGLAVPLFLPDEQDASSRPELVSAPVRGAR